MKKSTLTVIIAIFGCAATLAAINLKLKQEYSKGYIKSPFAENKLPVFHFIKAEFDSTSMNIGSFDISVAKKNGSSVADYYGEKAKLAFTVINDTLYIKKDPLSNEKNGHSSSIKIKMENLKGLFANAGYYKITTTQIDNLSVIAEDRAEISLSLNSVNTLSLKASDNAGISLSAENTIVDFSLELADKSKFTAKDITVKDKKIQFSKSATLQLNGSSLESFGLFNK